MRELRLGLLGRGIGHSRSAWAHREAAGPGARVRLRLVDVPDLRDALPLPELLRGLHGLLVTSPYKGPVAALVRTRGAARELGAANLVLRRGGRLEGELTDLPAAVRVLDGIRGLRPVSGLVILGDGVMARVAARAARERGLPARTLSRRLTPGFWGLDLARLARPGELVVNACARDYVYDGPVDGRTLFWDLNYDLPGHARLARALGGRYVDGLGLLSAQAELAQDLLAGKSFPSGGTSS